MNRYINVERFKVNRERLNAILADKRHNKAVLYALEEAVAAIDELLENRRPKAEWIVARGDIITKATCSNCGKGFYYVTGGRYPMERATFCPNCGADMRRV